MGELMLPSRNEELQTLRQKREEQKQEPGLLLSKQRKHLYPPVKSQKVGVGRLPRKLELPSVLELTSQYQVLLDRKNSKRLQERH